MFHALHALLLLLGPDTTSGSLPVSGPGAVPPAASQPVRLAARADKAAAAASAPGAAIATGAGAPAQPAPSDLAPALDRALRVGRLLHRLDRSIVKAVTKYTEDEPTTPEPPVEGHLAVPVTDALVRVYFVTPGEPGPLASTILQMPSAGRPSFQTLRPPQKLPETEARMYRAQRLAMAATPPKESERWGQVLVVPAEAPNQNGWAVYLLGAPADEETPVRAGFRVIVDADAHIVLEKTPLAGAGPTRRRKAPPEVKQTTGDTPTETHVMAALRHQQTVRVRTPRGRWVVTGEAIRYEGPAGRP